MPPDALTLRVRVSQPGWTWSAGIQLGTLDPGETLVKLRQRNQQETLLLRVDVHASKSGLALVSFSHQPLAFSPFRIDNCTMERLHVRQVRETGSSSRHTLRPSSHSSNPSPLVLFTLPLSP